MSATRLHGRRFLTAVAPAAICLVALTLWGIEAHAAGGVRIELGGGERDQIGGALKMVLILTVLALAPAILLATTSFVRIAIVLTFVRNALGVQNMPPNQVLMGLALFMTVAVMSPVGTELYDAGLSPYLEGAISAEVAIERGSAPVRRFMLAQTRDSDLRLFYEISKKALPTTPDEVSLSALIPAFMISELRTAFEMGFVIFIPFLLMDLIVASVLMSMGMVMLPPALVSLPIKVMLFVVADGWNLLVGSLVRSFG